MFFKKGLRDPSLIHKLTMKNPRISEAMFAIANKYALAEEATLDSKEQKKETWTILAHPRVTIRKGKRIVPSMRWNNHDATRSTGPSRVNLKASWITSAFSTPGKAQDLKFRPTPKFCK
jgi:hypothetical protein